MGQDKRLLVFAGAGASFATDREQYPTTVRFRELLPAAVKNHPAFSMVEAYLQHKKGVHTIDIEQVLWELQELEKYCLPVSTTDSFVNHIHQNGEILQLGVERSQAIVGQYIQLKSQIGHLIRDINKHVYDFYGNEPNPEKLENTWGKLLSWVKNDFDTVDIVTTNYDTVIEAALTASAPSPYGQITELGRRQGLTMEVDVGLWRERNRQKGLLTKLHGSVDWQRGVARGANVIKVVGAEFHGNHDTRVIIYPGYKDTPNSEPFTTFHEYFEFRLSQATHVLVIGFAFRDEHINTIFRRAVTSSQRVCVVDPSLDALSRQYPFSPKPTVQNTGFGQGTAGGGLLSDPTPEGFNNQLRHLLLDA
jgi:SIR2-like domain